MTQYAVQPQAEYAIAAFYKFIHLQDLENHKSALKQAAAKSDILARLLLKPKLR